MALLTRAKILKPMLEPTATARIRTTPVMGLRIEKATEKASKGIETNLIKTQTKIHFFLVGLGKDNVWLFPS